MKIYQKIKLSGKSLRTGLLSVCLLSALCALTGCGQEDRLLSELQREPPASLGENPDETASDYPETPQGNAGAQGSQDAGQDVGTKGSQDAGQAAGTIFVHVCGEVKSPGVYELPAGSRFYEAVEAAGGFTENACRDYLNMAASLADGSRLEIPSAEAVAGKKESGGRSGEAVGEDKKEYSYYTLQEDDTAPDQTGGGTEGASGGLVNINTADIAGLCALPGVGEGRAKAIIEYREKQGGFRKKEDIMEVSGIGEKMYARMEPYLTVE